MRRNTSARLATMDPACESLIAVSDPRQKCRATDAVNSATTAARPVGASHGRTTGTEHARSMDDPLRIQRLKPSLSVAFDVHWADASAGRVTALIAVAAVSVTAYALH